MQLMHLVFQSAQAARDISDKKEIFDSYGDPSWFSERRQWLFSQRLIYKIAHNKFWKRIIFSVAVLRYDFIDISLISRLFVPEKPGEAPPQVIFHPYLFRHNCYSWKAFFFLLKLIWLLLSSLIHT